MSPKPMRQLKIDFIHQISKSRHDYISDVKRVGNFAAEGACVKTGAVYITLIVFNRN